VLACLTIAGCLGMLATLILDPDGAEEYTVSRRPTLFYQVDEPSQRIFPDDIYEEVIGSAHNSGGRVEATLQALIFGADVIEADVVEVDGELYTAHTPPLPFLGPRFFRGPSLETIWTAAWRADAFKLDLKESSPEYIALVGAFIEPRSRGRDIIVSSRSPQALQTLHERVPEAILLLSVPDTGTFAALQDDERLLEALDGVTVRHTVIDQEMVRWMDARGKLVFAWTVNDLERANELIRLGVDGITTENLALLSLFGGTAQELPAPGSPVSAGSGPPGSRWRARRRSAPAAPRQGAPRSGG
jgi:hypothetical protein